LSSDETPRDHGDGHQLDTVLLRKRADGQRETLAVDVEAIGAGEAEDFFAQEDDLIVVPVSGPKRVLESMLGLVRVGINASK